MSNVCDSEKIVPIVEDQTSRWLTKMTHDLQFNRLKEIISVDLFVCMYFTKEIHINCKNFCEFSTFTFILLVNIFL